MTLPSVIPTAALLPELLLRICPTIGAARSAASARICLRKLDKHTIKTASGMLGHFSAGFTLDTYAHVTTAAQREAANTMGNVLKQ